MNRKLALYFLGTKLEGFMSSAYNFGFLLLFYQLTDSLFYSGLLTASVIVISRVLLVFIIPWLKKYSPIYVSAWSSIAMGIATLASALTFPLWSEQLICFFLIAALLDTISDVDSAFSNSIIPRIVDDSYLYKANSLNGMFMNAIMFVSPLVGYLFNVISFPLLLVAYGGICFISALVMFRLLRITGEQNIQVEPHAKSASKMRFFSDEWKKTFTLIRESADIRFCMMIGIIVNFVFAGMSGPYVLGAGGTSEGSTILKISLAAGSFLGVYGAFWLKVKENYNRYLRYSLIGILALLLILANVSDLFVNIACIVLLTMFIMFLMNTTGTFLQLATPRDELPSVYTFRASLYAVAVPLSYAIGGWLIEQFGASVYFYLSFIEVLVVAILWMAGGLRLPVMFRRNKLKKEAS